ncbi:hypothetical protein EW026_g1521 [Hermanssonia centrifuga]|uniref:Uncharacterized protein n=1 Tax=Hermanssonia centrifuga TaxID=98765 RepID=A0A4S4KR99_9APHY|nr:hypothetical protein EW026_g1521 [Hermanssonia centrifuga]
MVKKSHKRTLVAEQAEQPQPKKKQKIDNDHPRSHPVPKNKVGMSAKAKKILNVSPDGRRSGRTRVPSLKLRESEPPAALKLRMSSRKDVPTSPSLPMLDGESLDQVSYPAIPTTPTTPIASPTSPTSSEAKTPKSLAVLTQPRDANGRFGKKASTNGRFMRKHFSVGGKRYMKGAKVLKMRKLTRVPKTEAEDHNPFGDDFFLSEEAAYNDRLPLEGGHSDSSELSEVEFGEEALEDIILKRPHDTEEGEDSSSKRTRLADSEDELDYVSPTTSPKYTMGKGSLLRPNPISFARRKWAPVEDEDEDEEIRGHASRSVRSSTAEDTDPPVTPNDYADVGDPIDESAKMEVVDDCGVLEEPELLETELGPVAPVSVARLAVSTRVARLTVQPSPMNLARRRWAPPPPRFRDSENNKSGFRTSAPQPLAPALDVIVKVTKDSSLDSPAKELLGNLEWPSDSEASECYSDDLYSDDDDDDEVYAPLQPDVL